MGHGSLSVAHAPIGLAQAQFDIASLLRVIARAIQGFLECVDCQGVFARPNGHVAKCYQEVDTLGMGGRRGLCLLQCRLLPRRAGLRRGRVLRRQKPGEQRNQDGESRQSTQHGPGNPRGKTIELSGHDALHSSTEI